MQGQIFTGSCNGVVNHAVLAVGYGKLVGGQEYWIIRNSWNSQWGDNGHIYLPIKADDDYTGGSCKILSYAPSYPVSYSLSPGFLNTTPEGKHFANNGPPRSFLSMLLAYCSYDDINLQRKQTISIAAC